ncbi:MAG: hypothetical protein HY654_04595 [Acidobacteria bacterium]|nr:hypothetical protein [Acidobacteriota bacterium]
MDKKLWSAFGGAFIVIFLLSALFHLVVAADWMNTSFANVARPGGVLMIGIVAYYLVLSFMMAWLYPKGYEGKGPIAEGLRFGLAIGVLVYISEALHQFAVMDVTLGPALAHGAWHLVETTAGGLAIGAVYGLRPRRS